ncbi:hypothetical protein Tco_0852645 [Tanacetum coccineum]
MLNPRYIGSFQTPEWLGPVDNKLVPKELKLVEDHGSRSQEIEASRIYSQSRWNSTEDPNLLGNGSSNSCKYHYLFSTSSGIQLNPSEISFKGGRL